MRAKEEASQYEARKRSNDTGRICLARWLDAASNENLLDLSSSNVSGTTREKRLGKTDILI